MEFELVIDNDKTEAKDVGRLCQDWLKTKKAINELQEKLETTSVAILAAVGHKREGSKVTKHGPYTIETTGNMRRKVNWAQWTAACKGLARADLPLKEVLDETKFKKLAVTNPTLHAKLLAGEIPPVEETAGKASVKVTL